MPCSGGAWRATTHRHRASALCDSAASNGGAAPDDLIGDIRQTKQELSEAKDAIIAIKTGNETAMEKLGCGKADLSDLKAEKARLQGLLLQYETRLTSQQQQSGAGASMPLSSTRSGSPLHSQTRCTRRTAFSLGTRPHAAYSFCLMSSRQ